MEPLKEPLKGCNIDFSTVVFKVKNLGFQANTDKRYLNEKPMFHEGLVTAHCLMEIMCYDRELEAAAQQTFGE